MRTSVIYNHMLHFALTYWFDSISGYPESSVDSTDEQSDTKRLNRLLCLNCRQVITDQGKCIEIQGANTHRCVNTAAINYLFSCFSEANGCLVTEKPSYEHTWFSGYSWQIANCCNCNIHLGWFFIGEIPFYGLILDRMVSE